MREKMVLLEIVDPTVDVGEDTFVDRYLLVNPSEEKLNELEHLLSTVYDKDGEWYECNVLDKVSDFVRGNFAVAPMSVCTLYY